jgi:hypothetical protein
MKAYSQQRHRGAAKEKIGICLACEFRNKDNDSCTVDVLC